MSEEGISMWILILLGILVVVFVLWAIVNMLVSIIGIILPIAVAGSLWFILRTLIDFKDPKSASILFKGLFGVVIFVLILWRVF